MLHQLFMVFSLIACCMQCCYGLQNIWSKNAVERQKNLQKLTRIYKSNIGFLQWKRDGEYLMSDRFMNELFISNANRRSRAVNLIDGWLGAALISSSFDRGYCDWLERDEAIPFVKEMIVFYKNMSRFVDSSANHAHIVRITESLTRIMINFSTMQDPNDSMCYIDKSYLND